MGAWVADLSGMVLEAIPHHNWNNEKGQKNRWTEFTAIEQSFLSYCWNHEPSEKKDRGSDRENWRSEQVLGHMAFLGHWHRLLSRSTPKKYWTGSSLHADPEARRREGRMWWWKFLGLWLRGESDSRWIRMCSKRLEYSNLLRSPSLIVVSKEFVASRTGRAFWKVHDAPARSIPSKINLREYLP